MSQKTARKYVMVKPFPLVPRRSRTVVLYQPHEASASISNPIASARTRSRSGANQGCKSLETVCLARHSGAPRRSACVSRAAIGGTAAGWVFDYASMSSRPSAAPWPGLGHGRAGRSRRYAPGR
jgi:hypothetical protein